MANIRSAEKQRRQAEKAKLRNRAGKSKLRTQLKKARVSAEAGDKAALSATHSEIDRAARKKLIPVNTANRYKSRLAAATKKAATSAK